jgi:hypothetical protein
MKEMCWNKGMGNGILWKFLKEIFKGNFCRKFKEIFKGNFKGNFCRKFKEIFKGNFKGNF